MQHENLLNNPYQSHQTIALGLNPVSHHVYKYSLTAIEPQPQSGLYVLLKPVFVLQRRNGGIVVEVKWPVGLKYFSIWPFKKKLPDTCCISQEERALILGGEL